MRGLKIPSIAHTLWKEVLKSNFQQYGQMEKHRHEEAPTRRKSEERRSEKEKVRKEKMQAREKVGKMQNTVFFSTVLWLRRVEK